MSHFKRKGDPHKYGFIDARCIGRRCWAPGLFQHRAPLAGGGSMNTSSPSTPTCMNRAYRGCPAGPEGEETRTDPETGHPFRVQGVPVYQIELAKQRRADGWKVSR